jgi:hypothetical protein
MGEQLICLIELVGVLHERSLGAYGVEVVEPCAGVGGVFGGDVEHGVSPVSMIHICALHTPLSICISYIIILA